MPDEVTYDWLCDQATGGSAGRAGKGMILCPAHDDHNPSLHVSLGTYSEGGRILLKCHAGCDTESILQAWGVTFTVLFEPSRAHASAHVRTRGGSGSCSGGGEDVMVGREDQHERPRQGAMEREERLWLVRAYREQALPFEPLWRDEWPALPEDTSRARRLVADHCRLVRALLLAADDDRPFVLPSDEVAAELGLGKVMTHRAMTWLASYEVGFLAVVGQLPSRGGRRGAFLYLPGLGPAAGLSERAEEARSVLPSSAGGVEADDDVRR